MQAVKPPGPEALAPRPIEDAPGCRTGEGQGSDWGEFTAGDGPAPVPGEFRLRPFLIACLRSRWQPEALCDARAAAPQDRAGWDAVRGAADDGRLAPLLYSLVRKQGIVPADVEESWRGVYHNSLQRSARLFHELEKLLRAMDAAGVPVILLKGAALAEAVYRNIALRPMTDLDLLVRPADVPAALSVLRTEGYQTDEPFGYFAEVGAHKMGATPVLVDLHWSWIDLPYYIDVIDAVWLWGTARQAATGGTPALILGPEAQLLHLAAHMCLKENDQAGSLLHLHDIAGVLHLYAGEIDWETLLARAQAFDLVLPLQRVLPVVAREWGAPLPAEVVGRLARLRPSPQEARIARSLGAAGRSAFYACWTGLATLPSWQSRIRYSCTHLFPPASYMRWRYGIRHDALVPLSYPWRWLSALWSAAMLFGRATAGR